MTDIVFAHEGTVTKIIGDALHVLFGAPGEQADHAARAIACALELDTFAEDFRKRWSENGAALRGDPHRRPCRAGDRRQFRRHALLRLHGLWRHDQHRSASGDGEQAARDQGLRQRKRCRKGAGLSRTASRRSRAQGTDGAAARLRAVAAGRGARSSAGYLEAFAKLEAGDPGALAAFAAEVGKHPGDPLSSFHLKRLLNGAAGTRIVME